ncbi:MAG: metallophosphoesterase [Bacilli bacterium]|nr:metallophosphoesterase [Bacilli bacterium]
MKYIYKQYEIETKKDIKDKKIVTISDLHFNPNITKSEIDDLILKINDKLPEYIFLLGDITTFNNLEDNKFKENILYFFKLLGSISKTYLVLGNNDFLKNPSEKLHYVNKDKIIDFYSNLNIKLLYNYVVQDNDLNIIGFNKLPIHYTYELKDIFKLREEISEIVEKIKHLLDNDKYTIFLTHSHLDILKLQLEFFKNIDLILAGHTHNGLVPNFLENIFPKNMGIYTGGKLFQNNIRGMIKNDNQTIIVNGGITKISDSHSSTIKKLTKSLYPGEFDLINIKRV